MLRTVGRLILKIMAIVCIIGIVALLGILDVFLLLWVCAAWPDTGMCGIHGADDDISHAGLADGWCSLCNSSRKQSGDVLWYRSDNTYKEYRIWSGRVCRIMIIENDFVSRWHKVKIMKCIQYGKRNEETVSSFV